MWGEKINKLNKNYPSHVTSKKLFHTREDVGGLREETES